MSGIKQKDLHINFTTLPHTADASKFHIQSQWINPISYNKPIHNRSNKILNVQYQNIKYFTRPYSSNSTMSCSTVKYSQVFLSRKLSRSTEKIPNIEVNNEQIFLVPKPLNTIELKGFLSHMKAKTESVLARYKRFHETSKSALLKYSHGKIHRSNTVNKNYSNITVKGKSLFKNIVIKKLVLRKTHKALL